MSGRVAWYLPATKTALHGVVRGYSDSWSIRAIAPEVRLYQAVGDYALFRVKFRYYQQTRSFFYREPDQYTVADAIVTADPKMSALRNPLLGFQWKLRFGFLEESALDALSETTLELSFDYLWNTSRFGNGVVAQAGLSAPF